MGTQPQTILKLSTGNEEQCLRQLMNDNLSPFVPKINGIVHVDGQTYLEMQDLLAQFTNASVMDIKMGCRTYLEEELNLASQELKLRPDMYEKMIQVDMNEPTDEEKKNRAITKPRYMIWRETVSSTASLGFRIEGMRLQDGTVDKNFKTFKDEELIAQAFLRYAKSNNIRLKYLNRLYDLRQALTQSKFFSAHELIGSSLLFVHSDITDDANIWLIDFAKTHLLPNNTNVTHRNKWELGNHEDGFLTGVDNLIRIYESIIKQTTNNEKLNSTLANSATEQQEQNQLRAPSKLDLTTTSKKTATQALIHSTVNLTNNSSKVGQKINNSNGVARFLPELKT